MKRIILAMMLLMCSLTMATETDGVVLVTSFNNIKEANEWSAKNYDKVIVRAIRPYVCGVFVGFAIEFVPRDGVTINFNY